MRDDDRSDPPTPRDLAEETIARLLEALAILEAIERAELLSDLPGDPDAAARHQCAVSMLAVLRRDLATLAAELEANHLAHELLGRMRRSA
jgi:hypothetical protein